MSVSWNEVVLFDEENIDGVADAFFIPSVCVYDIDDIGSGRGPICPYNEDDLDEARDHADIRAGYVTGPVGDVVYVSPAVRPGHVVDRARAALSWWALTLAERVLAFMVADLKWQAEHSGNWPDVQAHEEAKRSHECVLAMLAERQAG
ncbi:hypothetical protein EN850_03005 [Mesorhizobium sp. M8A.F.Ca.ET.207.01.1.1]|uniref:hypothetical protein n=1 Tax=Mesorhizobium sp. M8A.F.Ca.ET.207.01.1.1 TaxID=2563968 RepID=UPI00109CF38A|nr:hypothetical protein [Mesorhizobium sp. M8A.F.Ca.ET.207.01.1.1]TGQ83727.1 hypothetical protein EN850_03005 [Mesorhizobium sp. M8A.F.Ca.ET.207.01.1.1]